MPDVFDGSSARSNPADPYFPMHPDGFGSFTIRQWRCRVTDQHMAAEGIDG